jgi:hypothetical protein
VPSLQSIRKAIVIGGAAPPGTPAPPGGAEPAYRRSSLRLSGVRQSDGSAHPLAMSRFRNARFAADAAAPMPRPAARRPGLSIFGGVIGRDFGHVLTQSLGRLWAAELAPDAPVLLVPETADVSRLPDHFVGVARSLGVTNDLVLVTVATLCDRLLVPQDLCNLEHRPSAARPFIDWLARNRPRPDPAAAGADKVYVSRSGLGPEKGQYLQESALEAALAANGYLVFHPEAHPVARQIAVYGRARQMIFADGSATHLWSIAAQPGQKVAVILRRPLDRHFDRWFRSVGCPRPAYVDGRIADLTRRGEGPHRGIAVLDLAAVWDQLRALGFHADPRGLGIDRTRLEAWLAARAPGAPDPAAAPVALDDRSRQILAGCRHVRLRQDPPRPLIPQDRPPGQGA